LGHVSSPGARHSISFFGGSSPLLAKACSEASVMEERVQFTETVLAATEELKPFFANFFAAWAPLLSPSPSPLLWRFGGDR
jgi:hypothetical protein